MHWRSTVLTMSSPKNSMTRHGPRILCGAQARPSSKSSASNIANPCCVWSRLSPNTR